MGEHMCVQMWVRFRSQVHMMIDYVSAWENYTRVSTPIYNNQYDFKPCSAKIQRWHLRLLARTYSARPYLQVLA